MGTISKSSASRKVSSYETLLESVKKSARDNFQDMDLENNNKKGLKQ